MKKLLLNLDKIQVVSFPVETMEQAKGTVNGFAATPVLACSESAGGSCESCFPHYCLPMPASARC